MPITTKTQELPLRHAYSFLSAIFRMPKPPVSQMARWARLNEGVFVCRVVALGYRMWAEQNPSSEPMPLLYAFSIVSAPRMGCKCLAHGFSLLA